MALPQGVSSAWGALDDVVMGGRSESGFQLQRGAGEDGGPAGVFSGMVRCCARGVRASGQLWVDKLVPWSSEYGTRLRSKAEPSHYKVTWCRCRRVAAAGLRASGRRTSSRRWSLAPTKAWSCGCAAMDNATSVPIGRE